MAKVTVVARLVAKADTVDPVKRELLKLITPTRMEAGCLEYRLHQDMTNPSLFIFYENWESRDCLERHLTSCHYKNYVTAVANLIAEKTVNIMTEVEA